MEGDNMAGTTYRGDVKCVVAVAVAVGKMDYYYAYWVNNKND
jgi:hypothetical protein